MGAFFFGTERDGCRVLVFPLLDILDEDEDGLFAGMFMLRTDSLMICRIVFKKALRNSDVL